jgi:hypothetical protein
MWSYVWHSYSHASLNDGDTFLETCRKAFGTLHKCHRVYLHKLCNLALTRPPYGWKSFQTSVSRIGRFHPYSRFPLASNSSPQSAYLDSPNILTTVVYVVGRWQKCHYAVHDWLYISDTLGCDLPSVGSLFKCTDENNQQLCYFIITTEAYMYVLCWSQDLASCKPFACTNSILKTQKQ